MKKVAFILLIVFVSLSSYGQIAVADAGDILTRNYGSFDISEIANDTVYWFRIRGNSPVSISVFFTNFNSDDAVANFYTGKIRNDSIYYNNIDELVTIDLPVTLDKTVYLTVAEGDTTHALELLGDYWKADLIGLFLDPNTATTGTYDVFIDK
jgi:hypothetical protein